MQCNNMVRTKKTKHTRAQVQTQNKLAENVFQYTSECMIMVMYVWSKCVGMSEISVFAYGCVSAYAFVCMRLSFCSLHTLCLLPVYAS